MNKRMMKLTMFVALSFFILVGTVSLSAGIQSSKVPISSKQSLPGTAAPIESAIAKAVFWDLAVDHFNIAGQTFVFPNNFNQAKMINVTVGQTISCQCFYKIKTLPVGDITKADAKAWGAGNLTYTIAGGLYFPGPPSKQEYKTEIRTLPMFTTADVQTWKSQLGAGGRKEWMESMVYTWTAKPEHVNKNMYLHFDVDSFFKIKETDEQNNGSFSASGVVAKFIVKPMTLTPGQMPVKQIQKNR